MTGRSTSAIAVAIIALAAGTYAFRVAGPALGARLSVSDRTRDLLNSATVVVLAALVATAALTQAGSPAGVARPTGVLVGGILAWRRAPLILVVFVAAATAAGLRALGVP